MILFLAGEFRTAWYTAQHWRKQKYDKLFIYTNAVEHITNVGLGIDQTNNISIKQVKTAFPDANISISTYDGVSTTQMYSKWKKFCENDFPDNEVICVSRPDLALFDYEFCSKYSRVDKLHLSYDIENNWADDILFVLPFGEFKLMMDSPVFDDNGIFMSHITIREYYKKYDGNVIRHNTCIVRNNFAMNMPLNAEEIRSTALHWWKMSGR